MLQVQQHESSIVSLDKDRRSFKVRLSQAEEEIKTLKEEVIIYIYNICISVMHVICWCNGTCWMSSPICCVVEVGDIIIFNSIRHRYLLISNVPFLFV